MNTCIYNFDVILMNVFSQTKDLCNLDQMFVSVKFKQKELILPKEQINVIDFPKHGGIDFEEDYVSLRKTLPESPVEIVIKYKNEPLATLKVNLPLSICDNLEHIEEAVYYEKLDYKEGNEEDEDLGGEEEEEATGGCVEVLIKFQPKCREDVMTVYPDPMCPMLQDTINPNDVIFIVGDEKGLNPCLKGDPQLKKPPFFKNLDFDKYRLYHGMKLSKTPSLPNTACSLNCSRFKEVAQKYGASMVNKLTCEDMQKGRYKKQKSLAAKCIKSQISPDVSGSSSEKTCCLDEPKGKGYTIPPPEYGHYKEMKPRFCIICRTNLKYLPPLATCPICGYKPEPIPKDIPIQNTLNVEEIVKEYANKDIPQIKCPTRFKCGDDESDEEEPRKCECTCAPGRVCAYCRVREHCDVKKASLVGRGSKPPKLTTENIIDEQNTVERATRDEDRPYLERIFSEFRDLHGLGTPKNKRESGGSCEEEAKKDDWVKNMPPSTACQDLRKIRKDPAFQKYLQKSQQKCKDKKSKGGKGGKKAPEKCKFKLQKQRQPKCGQCNPLGCLPCKKPYKTKCGVKLYDYCAFRGYGAPKIEHDNCHGHIPRVPCNMGWLWNVTGPTRGYKPGAIPKSIKELMKYFLIDFPADTLVVSRYCNYRKPKEPPFKPIKQQTTLEIEKKNNEYLITFRPLKDFETLKTAADPFLDIEPIQLRIMEDPQAAQIESIRKCLLEKGYRPCVCHQPVINCCCRTFAEKNFLLAAVSQECERRQVENCLESLVLEEDNDNGKCNEEDEEYNFGITPPAGIIKYHKMNKPDFAHKETQFRKEDWYTPPIFGRKLNKWDSMYVEKVAKKTGKKKAKGDGKKKKKKEEEFNFEKEPKPEAPPPVVVEDRLEALYKRIAENPKLAKLLGKDGKLDMMRYLKARPLLTGAAAAAERMRRLRLLLETIPMPFELKAKWDRCINSCMLCCGPPC